MIFYLEQTISLTSYKWVLVWLFLTRYSTQSIKQENSLHTGVKKYSYGFQGWVMNFNSKLKGTNLLHSYHFLQVYLVLCCGGRYAFNPNK